MDGGAAQPIATRRHPLERFFTHAEGGRKWQQINQECKLKPISRWCARRGACPAMGEQRGRGAARKVHRPCLPMAFQPSSPFAGWKSQVVTDRMASPPLTARALGIETCVERLADWHARTRKGSGDGDGDSDSVSGMVSWSSTDGRRRIDQPQRLCERARCKRLVRGYHTTPPGRIGRLPSRGLWPTQMKRPQMKS
jgi:hypothetical protein